MSKSYITILIMIEKPVKGVWFKRGKVVDLKQPGFKIAENVALKNVLITIPFSG